MDVLVEFGAKIDSLLSGVDRSKKALESVGESAKTVTDHFKELAAAAGVAFSIEGVRRFVESMAQLGQQTESISARLGQSAEQVGTLSGIAKITGTNVESLALSIERASLNIQRSRTDAFSPVGEALKALGLTAKDLTNVPADQFFLKLSDAVSKFNPSLNLTNALMVVGGRNIAQMIPALRLGSEGFAKLQAEVRKAQEGLAAAIPGMAQTDTKLGLLSLSVQSLGARIFTALKPAIDLVIDGLTRLVQRLDVATIREFAVGLIDTLGNAIISLIELFSKLGTTIDEVLGKLKRLLAGAAIGGAVGILGGPAGVLLGALGGAGIAAAWDMFTEQNKAGTAKADESLKETVDTIRARMAQLRAAIQGGGEGEPAAGGGLNAPAIGANLRGNFDARIAQIQGVIALSRGAVEQMKVIYQRDADLYAITEQDKIRLTRDRVAEQFQIELAGLTQIKQLQANAGLVQEAQATNNKILLLQQQFNTEMIRLNADLARSYKAIWDDVFGALQSSFNSQLRGLLAGTVSFKDAFRTILGDMIVFFIQMVEKMVFQWIAGKLAMLAVDKSTAAASQATELAAQEATLPAKIARFTSDITSDAALVFSGIFANLAPLLGPGAAGPAAAGQASVLAQIANIPKFELGTDYVPRTGLAIVHEGEKITPAGQNTGAGGGGDAHLHLHAMVMDGPSVAKFFRQNADMIAATLKSRGRLATA